MRQYTAAERGAHPGRQEHAGAGQAELSAYDQTERIDLLIISTVLRTGGNYKAVGKPDLIELPGNRRFYTLQD